MRRLFLFFSVFVVATLSCWAQDKGRHEITVQGSGFFGESKDNNGIDNETTDSGGFMAGYRFNLNKRFAFEGDYDFFSNSQKYMTTFGGFQAQTRVHGITGTAVFKLPPFHKIKPFLLAGGGALVFDPRNGSPVERQTRGTFGYGAGADVPVMKHVAVRAQYRGFVYKVPDFDVSLLKMDKFTHAAVPSAGLVFSF